MRLYLVRHGFAKSKEEDTHRSLSATGIGEIKRLAAFLKPLDLHVQAVWHSGKARAAQTAELLGPSLKIAEEVLPHDGLNPDDEVKALRKELVNLGMDMMIVGHLPHLGRLASLLLFGNENEDILVFRQGSILALNNDEGFWQIEWFINPDLLPH